MQNNQYLINILATAPTLVKGFNNPTYIFKGIDNTLSCEFESAPNAEVTWSKDTRPLTSGTNDLVLKNVKDDDSGDYKCVGTNVKGDASSGATVHAIGIVYLHTVILFMEEEEEDDILFSFKYFYVYAS